MKILRWMAVSFSLFSRIPMPHFKWEEEDMAKSLLFFPFVGAVIGAFVFGAGYLYYEYNLPFWAVGALILLIPILLTGGFHLDGYMDVKDAISSYAPREKKLEILKDPHVGSFAIIGLITRVIIAGVSICLILLQGDMNIVLSLALVFWNGRCLSAITSITFPKARKDGMLYSETKKHDIGETILLVVQLLAGLAFTFWADAFTGVLEMVAGSLIVLYYWYKTGKEFGGVTGDTAGYFITCFESDMFLFMAVMLWIR